MVQSVTSAPAGFGVYFRVCSPEHECTAAKKTQKLSRDLVPLIVVDVYHRHTFVVIDINNHRYELDAAH